MTQQSDYKKTIAAKMIFMTIILFFIFGLTAIIVIVHFHNIQQRIMISPITELQKIVDEVFQFSRIIMLILFLLIAASLGGMYWLILRHIHGPIKIIHEKMEEIQRGNLDISFQLNRKDEWLIVEHALTSLNSSVKSTDAELQKTRNYLSILMKSMLSIVIEVNHEGRVVLWNCYAESLSGISHKDAVGKDLKEVFPETKEYFNDIIEAIQTGKPMSIERVSSGQPHQLQYWDMSIYPLKDSGIEGAVILLKNITNRVRLEEVMVQTNKMMSIGGLAAGMAHEINNPLGGILGAAQVIELRLSPDNAKNASIAAECGVDLHKTMKFLERQNIFKFIDNIKSAGAKAAKIVQDMLNYTRQSESNMKLWSVETVIENSLSLAATDYDLKKKFDFRKINIIRDYAPNLPQLTCSLIEIEQVLLNLFKNAAYSMADNKQKNIQSQITIRTKHEDEMIRIDIEDNGAGLDEKTKKQVFEPFFIPNEAGIGTGFGLSVSYFIVTKKYKGTLSVESEQGSGARFTLRLPVRQNPSIG